MQKIHAALHIKSNTLTTCILSGKLSSQYIPSVWRFIARYIAAALLAQPLSLNAQATQDGWDACVAKYDAPSCQAYASSNEVPIRRLPHQSSTSIETLRAGGILLLHDPIESPKTAGWLPTQALVSERVSRAWVSRADILLNWQFHKVVNCWPISHLEWSERGEGDVPSRTFRALLEPSGKTTIYARIDDQGPRLNKFERLNNDFAIYFANGLFRLADIKKKNQDGWLFSLFKLDNNSGEVSIKDSDNIYKLLVVKKHSKDELKLQRCSLMPEVDQKWSLLPKPRRR